jgi:FtsH-binding integral membrane protein
MALGLLASRVASWAAVGLPPRQETQADPLSWTGWIVVVGGLVLCFYGTVRFMAWLDVKISSMKLLYELRRELERHHRPPS